LTLTAVPAALRTSVVAVKKTVGRKGRCIVFVRDSRSRETREAGLKPCVDGGGRPWWLELGA
jgi:hypothetical protein